MAEPNVSPLGRGEGSGQNLCQIASEHPETCKNLGGGAWPPLEDIMPPCFDDSQGC